MARGKYTNFFSFSRLPYNSNAPRLPTSAPEIIAIHFYKSPYDKRISI
jgi:hypothetical protein